MAKATAAQLKAELERRRAAQQPAGLNLDPTADMGQLEAGMVGIGKGMMDVINLGREGINFLTGDEEAQAQLEERQRREAELFGILEDDPRLGTAATIGEVAGETLITLPAGMGAGSAALRGTQLATKNPLLQRIAASGAAGATEGGIIAATEDAGAEGALAGGGIAIGAELLLPQMGKVLGRIFRSPDIKVENFIQVADGQMQPSQQLTEALDAVGMNFDDITQQAVRELPAEAVSAPPEQVARRALFEREGIPMAARSRMTQNPDDFQKELQLARQRAVGEGDKQIISDFRARFFDESEAFQNNLRNLSEGLGDAEDIGKVKDALVGLNSNLQSAKRQAYTDLRELAAKNPEITAKIPIQTDNILEAAQESQKVVRGQGANDIDEVLAEFGLAGEVVEKKGRFTTIDFGDGDTVKIRGDVKPLTVGNLEDFRKQFNDMFDMSDPRQALARNRMTAAIDDSTDVLVDGLGDVTQLPGAVADAPAIMEAAKRARGLASQQKKMFSAKDLVDDLTSLKPGTGTPVVEASKALGKIRNAPTEQVLKMVTMLRGAGDEGQAAISNLQAAKVVELLEKATASTPKLVRDGAEPIRDISGKNLRQNLTKERALFNTLFKDNPEVLEQLDRLVKIGELRATPENAAQKGSAPDLINGILRSIEQKGQKVPVAGEKAAEVAAKTATRREAGQMTELTPTQDTVEDFIVFNAPRLAANLGLVTAPTVSVAAPSE